MRVSILYSPFKIKLKYKKALENIQGLLHGAWGRNRTADTGIFSPLLYRLSYPGLSGGFMYTLFFYKSPVFFCKKITFLYQDPF